jgi:RNA polymerase sigma-70 factor (ECF subfamily)
MTMEMIHDEVRIRYAAAATRANSGGCCSSDPETIGAELYSALERAELPDAAVLASLGCGNPTAVADLREGERVLEVEEVAVSSKYATFDDYLLVRGFALVTESTYNNYIFQEIIRYLAEYGISPYDWMRHIWDRRGNFPTEIAEIFQSFRDETQNELFDAAVRLGNVLEERTREVEAARSEFRALRANLDQIVRQHWRKVFNLAYKFVGRHDEAEDLTQDIFLKIFKALHTFDRRANFQTWLISISRNLCIDHYRSVRKERETMARDVDASELSPASRERGPDSQLELVKLKKLIHSALGELPIALRQAVVLRDLQELSYQEIADQLGLPEGTVKSRINRGRIELARQLRRLQHQHQRPPDVPGAPRR